MNDVRVERSFDGLCTVYVGTQIVVSDLTEDQAAELAKAYSDHPSAS